MAVGGQSILFPQEPMIPISIGNINMGELSMIEMKILKSGAPGNAAIMEDCAKYFLQMPKQKLDRLALEILRLVSRGL